MHSRICSESSSTSSTTSKHIAGLFLIVALMSGLSACVVDPEPDSALVAALNQAEVDVQALAQSAPEVSALRAEQATEIKAEIERLCGFDDNSAVPETCQVDMSTIAHEPVSDAPNYLLNSRDSVLDSLATIPSESVALISQHYIELAPFLPDTTVGAPAELALTDAELETAQQLLAAEFAAVWALGVTLAQENNESLEAVIENHRKRTVLLRQILEPQISTEPAEPGYQLPELAPAELIMDIQTSSIDSWHAAAAQAETEKWRELAAMIAGDTARETAMLGL